MKVLGRMSIKQLLFDDLAETVLPGDLLVDMQNGDVEVPGDPRFQIAKSMDVFITRVSEVSPLHQVAFFHPVAQRIIVVPQYVSYSLSKQGTYTENPLPHGCGLGCSAV